MLSRFSLHISFVQPLALAACFGFGLCSMPQAQELAQPTPLILKDGRIANVSVYSIPFIPGTADLSPGNQAKLLGTLVPAATDCFLTAQAIGHVEPDSARQDALDGHRLARDRADLVQRQLIELGLPAESIASVWDWQFQVQDASVTLWLFELASANDCQGVPLEAAVAAAADNPNMQAQQKPTATAAVHGEIGGTLSKQATGSTSRPEAKTPAAPKTAAVKPSMSTKETVTAKASTAAKSADSKPAIKEPVAEPKALTAVTEDNAGALTAAAQQEIVTAKANERPAIKEMLDEARRATKDASAELDAMARPGGVDDAAVSTDRSIREAITAVDKAEPAQVPKAASTIGSEPTVVAARTTEPAQATPPSGVTPIVFDVNSSWMTDKQRAPLDKLLTGLPASGNVNISLTAAVGAGDVNSKSRTEDEKYNRWMAERRIGRVQEYLQSKAGGRQLTFTSNYRTNDNSRAVEVAIAR